MGINESGLAAILPDDPERAAIEQFIRGVFHKVYGARIRHFAHVLLGIRGSDGQWVAALGFTAAADHALYVENYGGGSVENQISTHLSTPVKREQIVEVGNLAASSAGAVRMLIAKAIDYLFAQGFSWVIFTATRAVANSFSRLELRPITLAAAEPARLRDRGRNWGSYYQTRPKIMAGSIVLAYLSMKSRYRSLAGAGA